VYTRRAWTPRRQLGIPRGSIMKRIDWLLLSVGDSIQPIQLQKTLFKFAMEAGVDSNEAYSFEPYNWGPCSFEIYADLEELREKGLIRAVPSGRGWSLYQLTDEGKEEAERIAKTAAKEQLEKLRQIKKWVEERSFSQLLRDVYYQYPEFAEKSMFK
jgi:uncharacterized protein YwgA